MHKEPAFKVPGRDFWEETQLKIEEAIQNNSAGGIVIILPSIEELEIGKAQLQSGQKLTIQADTGSNLPDMGAATLLHDTLVGVAKKMFEELGMDMDAVMREMTRRTNAHFFN